ncbi:hypothetical protein FOL47_001717 [Perkinsus chesapeaki]|uniref:Uncharacterized protein n=1 Tax=Perkinsus chesapeaki TaxID=330153 RepID=A0A7J6MHG0_PERCH|nr:hypothetical protein FOL47_001717 [Perkinsus chesapeaki]
MAGIALPNRQQQDGNEESALSKLSSEDRQVLKAAVELIMNRAEQQAHIGEMIRDAMLAHSRTGGGSAKISSTVGPVDMEYCDKPQRQDERGGLIYSLVSDIADCQLSPPSPLPAEPVNKFYEGASELPLSSPPWASSVLETPPPQPLKRKFCDTI